MEAFVAGSGLLELGCCAGLLVPLLCLLMLGVGSSSSSSCVGGDAAGVIQGGSFLRCSR